jgi:WD40 repeat protein
VTSLAFDDASRRLATASTDGTARIWDLAAGTPLATCQGHRGSVTTVDISSDGSLLATAGNDGTARVWELPACRELLRFGRHQGTVRAAVFDVAASRLATVDSATVYLWDLPRESRSADELAARLALVSPVCIVTDQLGRSSVPPKGSARRCSVR